MAKIFEEIVDSESEDCHDYDEENDVGLQNLEKSNRALSSEISTVLKLLWEQYKVHDVLNVANTFPSEISSMPSRKKWNHRPKQDGVRCKFEPQANIYSDYVNTTETEAVDSPMESPFHPQKFQTVINVLTNLERIALEDFLKEDFFFPFLHQFLLKYTQVFVVDPKNDQQWQTHLKDEVTEFVHSKSEQKLEHLFFLLRNDRICDLMVFNVADASFYFYENSSNASNVVLARELVFSLRHLLHADQMVHALCPADTISNTLFAVEMLMRILFNAVDYRLHRPILSLTQLVNLTSYSDCLAVVVISQFIIAEINHTEHMLMNILFDSSNLPSFG